MARLRLLLLSITLFWTACATVPFTNRSQLQIVPQTQMLQLSQETYQQILDEAEVVRDEQQVQPLIEVGNRLAQATEAYMREQGRFTESFAWEFILIQDEQINAFALPSGKIVFHTGILPIAQDQNGIAAIMGHEIAHVVARHGNERMSQALLMQMGGTALAQAIAQQPVRTQEIFAQVYGMGTQLGVQLPHSRMQESEADRIGIMLMAMAGYDPRAAIGLWQRMDAANRGGQPPSFLSTHPSPQERIANLQRFMPDALQIYQ